MAICAHFYRNFYQRIRFNPSAFSWIFWVTQTQNKGNHFEKKLKITISFTLHCNCISVISILWRLEFHSHNLCLFSIKECYWYDFQFLAIYKNWDFLESRLFFPSKNWGKRDIFTTRVKQKVFHMSWGWSCTSPWDVIA